MSVYQALVKLERMIESNVLKEHVENTRQYCTLIKRLYPKIEGSWEFRHLSRKLSRQLNNFRKPPEEG